MKVKGLTIVLRPRPMAESADLGVALVQAHWRSIWRCYAPVLAITTLLVLPLVTIKPWLPLLLLFWLKPWLDRTLLFVMSRAVFGQSTDLRALWQQCREVWLGQPLRTLLGLRLSPWRSYLQALVQLEGQKGKALRLRRRQILKGRSGAALGVQWAFANIEVVLYVGVFCLVFWLAPKGSSQDIFNGLKQASAGLTWAVGWVLLQAGTMLIVEPFFVASGFAMYLNRRVELEAWDIEQEFRRAFAT